MIIDNDVKLRAHLKVFKYKLKKAGYEDLQIYPAFCQMYSKNPEKYQLPKTQVLDMACEILIEET